MNRFALPLAASCMALALAGCTGRDRDQSLVGPGDSASSADLAVTGSSLKANPTKPILDHDDQAFLANAAGDDAYQIALARLALQRSDDPRIKELAQKVKADHTRMNNELAAISEQRGTVQDSPPVQVEDIRDVQNHLGALGGAEFNRAFIGAMVKDHQRAITMFEREASDGKDDAVRGFATKEVATLREHLAMAQALETDQRDPDKAAQ